MRVSIVLALNNISIMDLSHNLSSISAYNGGLVASLTYPVRSKEVNTFADLLTLPDEATVAIGRWMSHYEMLEKATDPVLQVG